MISRRTGFKIKKASAAISASHSSMLASRRRNLEAIPEKCSARMSRELSVTFLSCRDLDAEGFTPLLDDFRHALGDLFDRGPDGLQILGRFGALWRGDFGPDGFVE